jgi:hypothetical protein
MPNKMLDLVLQKPVIHVPPIPHDAVMAVAIGVTTFLVLYGLSLLIRALRS